MINRLGLLRPSRYIPVLVVGVAVLALVPADVPTDDGTDAGPVVAAAARTSAEPAASAEPAIKIATVSQKPPPEPARQAPTSETSGAASSDGTRPSPDDTAVRSTEKTASEAVTGTSAKVPETVAEPLPEEAEAEPNYRIARVGASALNVRAGPSSSNQKLFVLRPGEPVRVSEVDGNWARIVRGDGDEGWVFGRYLTGLNGDAVATAPTEASDSAASEQPRQESPSAAARESEEAPSADAGTGRYARSASNVPARAAPSPGAAQLFVLPAGERVKIAEVRGPWVRIITDSGVSGWVRFR